MHRHSRSHAAVLLAAVVVAAAPAAAQVRRNEQQRPPSMTLEDTSPWYRRRHAFWGMYGLGLPDSVLQKIYFRNALRIVKGMDASGFPR